MDKIQLIMDIMILLVWIPSVLMCLSVTTVGLYIVLVMTMIRVWICKYERS